MTGAGSKKQKAKLTAHRWDLSFLTSHLPFAILLLWRPLFAGETFFWGTPLLQFVPWQRMAAQMWRGGQLPLWNPLVGCGAPLAANYQTAAFYPLNLLSLLLPAEVALSWTTALHLALAGWGMYRWARAVGLDHFPALIGGLAFEGSGFLVARVALFPSMAFTFPWLAVWLWRAEVLAQRRRMGDALLLGLVLGLGLLAGHAQTAFYGGLLLAAYLAFRAIQEARGREQEAGDHVSRLTFDASRLTFDVPRFFSLVVFSFVVGLGLAAVQLLPTAELMLSSQRSAGVGYDFAMTYSLWPWRLITFAAPDFFGSPDRGDYWGYATYWEDAGYIGVLPLLLAAHAVVLALGKKQDAGRRKQETGDHASRLTFDVSRLPFDVSRFPFASIAVFWLLVAIVTLILALGKNTPVFPFLFRRIPTFDMFQAPSRWLAVTTVAFAALAALGTQQWPAGHRGRRLGTLGVVVGVALLIGGLAASRLMTGIPVTFGPATARLGGYLAAAGALMLLRRDSGGWRATVVIFVALDLLLFGWSLVPAADRSLYQDAATAVIHLEYEPGPMPVRVYWPADPVEPNSEYGAEYRVKFSYLAFDDFGPRDVDYWWGMREALLPNVGMLDGVASANNFEPLLVGRYADLLEAAVEAPDLLRVMGVTHVASDRPWPGGESIYTSESATLYRLPDALGRAWVVPAARQVPADEMLAALADPVFNPTTEVLLEQPPSSIQRPVSSIQHQVTLQDTPNGITIHAVLDAPGYLVLADTWYPGWQATVDGKVVPLLRANYAFRAVMLDVGEHIVEMRYRPMTVRLGAAMSLGMLALVVVIAGWQVRRRR